MKIIVNHAATADPPLFSFFIHDAPHRRMHIKVIEQYRIELRKALAKIGITRLIEHPIEVWILFVNPSSPDLGNLYLAFEQAMDDKTLTKPGIVADDSLIVGQETKIFFNQPKKK
jgi:hypothetical protein